jgi:hypothetical protein
MHDQPTRRSWLKRLLGGLFSLGPLARRQGRFLRGANHPSGRLGRPSHSFTQLLLSFG